MQDILDKAKNIRLVIFDVDGVLTTGALTYRPDGSEDKTFHVQDGMGMRMLASSGIHVAIITARKSAVVEKRMQDLNIEHVYQGYSDKILAFDDVKKKLNVQDHEIAYMGDDLPDLPVMRRVGFSISVPNAASIIQQHANYVTKKKGGKGAVRELSDLILQAQNKYDVLIQNYLER
jgi:3-deoxy-D-manno-octulosonate 8-phosphate phosphatase (KDO 8-P phosphatase)